MKARNVLDLEIPVNKTSLMQMLQQLVARGNRFWVGGISDNKHKLEALVFKLSERYPGILRTGKQREYDSKRGLARMHLVVFPGDSGRFYWWLLGSEGKGGLADPSSEDAKAVRDAKGRDSHIEFEDYVLHYATKQTSFQVPDVGTGKVKSLKRNTSTWTWKMLPEVYKEELETLLMAAQSHNWELIVRTLAALRNRPQFAGVRNQVLSLHHAAQRDWRMVERAWRATHRHEIEKDAKAGTLLTKDEANAQTAKMRRQPFFTSPSRPTPFTIRDLVIY